MSASSGGQTATQPATTRPKTAPRWHVILLDDNDHTYDYVVEMLQRLFGHAFQTAFAMAREVDTRGRVIVETTALERAEFKRDQIHAYGPGPAQHALQRVNVGRH